MKDVKCKNCKRYRYQWCRCIDDSPDPDIPRGCSYFIQKTNADHIRSMTDEELGGMFARFMSDILEQNGMDDAFEVDSTFADDMVHWLKKPYKEDS